MSIEALITDFIEGKRRSFFFEKMLMFASKLYQCAVFLRNALYDKSLCKSVKFPVLTISVGNIVAGGTGKTPFVQKLIQEISKKPGSIAVITRGYRSEAEKSFALASTGSGPLVPPQVCGDEPYWLAKTTEASIWVGKDRSESMKKALGSKPLAFLLEDGFQHRKVQRDVEIVLLSAQDLFGKNAFLPKGYLRDSPRRLKQADFIVVTKLDENTSKEEIEKKIREFSAAPITGFSSSYECQEGVKASKVGAFCGIARPESFYQALASEGIEVVDTLTLLDHQEISKKGLERFAKRCESLGAKYLICTEKDLVKLSKEGDFPLPIEVLKMRFDCAWNENVWKEIVQSIQTRM